MITLASPYRTLSATTVTEIGKAMFSFKRQSYFQICQLF